MDEKLNIGIIICDRYHNCAGGKCFRAMHSREGAFQRYQDMDINIHGFTTCDGCPGGNIEYAIDEMKSNGVKVVHLATGFIVGYPPCPYLEYFHDFIEAKFNIEVVYGTHPIPQKYLTMHKKLQTWQAPIWDEILEPTLANKEVRLAYD